MAAEINRSSDTYVIPYDSQIPWRLAVARSRFQGTKDSKMVNLRVAYSSVLQALEEGIKVEITPPVVDPELSEEPFSTIFFTDVSPEGKVEEVRGSSLPRSSLKEFFTIVFYRDNSLLQLSATEQIQSTAEAFRRGNNVVFEPYSGMRPETV